MGEIGTFKGLSKTVFKKLAVADALNVGRGY